MASSQTVTETIAEIVVWRPVLEPVLRTFEPVLAAQADLVVELAESMLASGPVLPEFSGERARQGVSLLAEADMAGAAESMRISAVKLLPLLEKIEAVASHISALNAYFLQPVKQEEQGGKQERDTREVLAEALIAGNGETVERIAGESKLDSLMLAFVGDFIVSTVLRAMVAGAISEEGPGSWNEGDIWQQGYCPVCGSLPSLGWLDKPAVDEKNAFLAGGGGKKQLHCGQCGANWRFRRGACPACGEEGSGTMEILRESGISHGERLDWCTKCKSYCPAIDLREREFVPNLEAAAIGLMHLDIVAARKELRPLRPSFWNMF